MQLTKSTDDFKIKGIPYSDFPILIDANNDVFVEALMFLIHHCIKRGSVQSKRSWDTFGRDLYDYFAFLEANKLGWRDLQYREDETILALYRDASFESFNLSATTVNRRLRFVIKFYNYAARKGWVSTLPYELEEVIVSKPKGFLAHTDTSGGKKSRPDVVLKQPRTQIKVLNSTQIKDLLSAIKEKTKSKTLHLMVRLSLATGLRKEEVLTFPKEYILNPARTSAKSFIAVRLNPSEISTKGDEPRTIHIPITVMEELWDYVIHERNKLVLGQEDPTNRLFVNRYGKAWSLKSKSFNNQLERLDLDFPVHPHIFRHTYATHTLKSLRSKKGLSFDPLVYVQKRLGHSSLLTTQLYMHFLDEIEDELITEYQQEIDAMVLEEING